MDGRVLLIDKPLTWTSFDIVNKIRYALKKYTGLKRLKVGHAGTLDPLASGLLIVCTGKMTKQLDRIQAEEKEYTGTMVLGATTPSYDAETAINANFDIGGIREEQLYNTVQKLTGNIEQTAPMYSALKVDGERLYEKARRGEKVALKSRSISIIEFELTNINLPEAHFRVVCSKGTYIRSLASDFGKLLNNGAYLSALTRTKSGDFSLENAWPIHEFVTHINSLGEGKNFRKQHEDLS